MHLIAFLYMVTDCQENTSKKKGLKLASQAELKATDLFLSNLFFFPNAFANNTSQSQ